MSVFCSNTLIFAPEAQLSEISHNQKPTVQRKSFLKVAIRASCRFLRNSNYKRTVKSILLIKMFLGLVEKTFGLVY